MEESHKEAELFQLEVVENRKGLKNAARNFSWVNPEIVFDQGLGEVRHKTNREVINEAVRDLEALKVTDDAQGLFDEVVKIREKANSIYKGIYAKEPERKEDLEAPYYHGIEPYYHGIGDELDWSGHNDYVMAVAARLFVGLVKFKQSGNREQLDALDAFFGQGWQDQELTLDDFKSLIIMAAFHEVGEWWIKDFWQRGLEYQRDQFDKQVEAGQPIEEIEIKPILRELINTWPEEERKDGINETKAVISEVGIVVSDLGLKIDYDPEKEASEFYLYFQGGTREEIEFQEASKTLPPTGKKSCILARLYKAADFAQCLSPEYQKPVVYRFNGETVKKRKGALVLYEELNSFKPGGLPKFRWLGPEHAKTSQYFYDEFLEPNTANEYILALLDQALTKKGKPLIPTAENQYRKRVLEIRGYIQEE